MHGHSHQQRQRATGSDLCLLTRLNTYDTIAIVAAGNLLPGGDQIQNVVLSSLTSLL